MAPATHPVQAVSAPNAYAALFARCVAGDLAPDTLNALCDAIDDTPASPDERRAFARFCLDALAEGDADLALPTPTEIADVLATLAQA